MPGTYVAYHFTVSPKEPASEILIAQLAEVGFESFVENEKGLTAYILKESDEKGLLDSIYILQSKEFQISHIREEIAQVNWNQEWEQRFDPIVVDELVSIRAPFHKEPILKYDILIEPKMSFGTGHHETTHLMIQHLLAIDLTNKDVLDMGCGTGILAIFSEMKGARSVDAVDIDEWSYQNAIENCERNRCNKISVYKGDASVLINKKYDLIIANINRNVLINDLPIYDSCLNSEAHLLLSGFYHEDIPLIENEASKIDLKLEKIIDKNEWVALRYYKN